MSARLFRNRAIAGRNTAPLEVGWEIVARLLEEPAKFFLDYELAGDT
jgi:hypothetical protein